MKSKTPTYEFNIVCWNIYHSVWANYKIIAKGRNTAIKRAKTLFKNSIGIDPKDAVFAQIISYKEIE